MKPNEPFTGLSPRILGCGLAATASVVVGSRIAPLPARPLALSLSPTLSGSPAEALWAFSTALFSGLPGRIEHLPSVLSLALGLLAFFSSEKIGGLGRGAYLWIGLFVFPCLVIPVGLRFGEAGFLTGPDAVVFLLFGVAFRLSDSFDPGRESPGGSRIEKIFPGVIGVLCGMGILHFLLLAPVLGRFQKAERPGRYFRILFPCFFIPVLFFLLLRTRYPNPFSPPTGSALSEWAGIWFYGGSLVASMEGPRAASVTGFPGIVLYACVGLSVLFAGLCRLCWRTSAGRTVPVQVALLLIPLVVTAAPAATILFAISEGDEEEKHSFSRERQDRLLRTLLRTLPPNTRLDLPPSTHGRAFHKVVKERFRNDLSLGVSDRTGFENRIADGETDRPTRAYSEGTNWLLLEREPIAFAGQYLLNATTEVYAASPTYFIGADPPPRLYYRGDLFAATADGGTGVADWSFDGERFFLYRTPGSDPWKVLTEGWSVSYYGYLLDADVERWGGPPPRKTNEGMDGFYRR